MALSSSHDVARYLIIKVLSHGKIMSHDHTFHDPDADNNALPSDTLVYPCLFSRRILPQTAIINTNMPIDGSNAPRKKETKELMSVP